jgi:membrane protein DedA with SNARE-associated domain
MKTRILLTIGYLLGTLLQELLAEKDLVWWILQFGFLGIIHIVWWLVLIIKRKLNPSRNKTLIGHQLIHMIKQ